MPIGRGKTRFLCINQRPNSWLIRSHIKWPFKYKYLPVQPRGRWPPAGSSGRASRRSSAPRRSAPALAAICAAPRSRYTARTTIQTATVRSQDLAHSAVTRQDGANLPVEASRPIAKIDPSTIQWRYQTRVSTHTTRLSHAKEAPCKRPDNNRNKLTL